MRVTAHQRCPSILSTHQDEANVFTGSSTIKFSFLNGFTVYSEGRMWIWGKLRDI